MHLHMHTKLTMQQNWTLIDKWKWYLVKYSFSETDPQYNFLLIFQKIIYLLCLSNRKLYICEIKFVKNRSFPQLNFCWFFFLYVFRIFFLFFHYHSMFFILSIVTFYASLSIYYVSKSGKTECEKNSCFCYFLYK